MPRGAPDYQQIETQTVRLEQGTVNLNVYQTGFSRLDGGGRVVWFDDFHSGLYRHLLSSSDGGANPSLSFDANRMFGFSPSCKFSPLASGGISDLRADIMLPLSNKAGFEIGLFMPTNHGEFSFAVRFGRSAGSPFAFGLDILQTTNTIKLDTSLGYQTIFTPAVASQYDNRHLAIKLVFDMVTGKYSSFLLGEGFLDISQYSGSMSANYPPGSVTYEFYETGKSAVLKEPIYLDYIILTADEP